jgi:hypothetical protein
LQTPCSTPDAEHSQVPLIGTITPHFSLDSFSLPLLYEDRREEKFHEERTMQHVYKKAYVCTFATYVVSTEHCTPLSSWTEFCFDVYIVQYNTLSNVMLIKIAVDILIMEM